MKSLRTTTKEFLAALNEMKKVVKKKSRSLPVLECVLITAHSPERIRIVGTDLETVLIKDIPCDVAPDFQALLNLRSLIDVLKSAKSESVTIEQVSDTSCKVTMNRTGASEITSNIELLNPDQFPVITPPDSHGFVVSRKSLNDMVQKAAFCDTDCSRVVFTGMNFIVNGQVRAMATNGKLLTVMNRPVIGTTFTNEEKSILIRREVLELVESYTRFSKSEMKKGNAFEQEITVVFDDARVMIEVDNETKIISKQIEGRFPDMVKALLADDQHTMQTLIDRSQLQPLLGNGKKTCCKLTCSENKAVVSILDWFENKELTRSEIDTYFTQKQAPEITDPYTNETRYNQAVNPSTFGFDCAYLNILLDSLSGDLVTLRGTDSTSSFQVNDGPDRFLIMPARV